MRSLLHADSSSTERRSNHKTDSLETMVENLVKNWEVEASHKLDVSEWRTVDPENYTFAINGGPPQDAKHMLKVCVTSAPLREESCDTLRDGRLRLREHTFASSGT